jgi:hypothetical protein
MKFLQLNLTTLILRFYLLMAVVIIAFFAGIPWLSILALPILFSALMGIRFQKQAIKTEGRPSRNVTHTLSQEAQAN